MNDQSEQAIERAIATTIFLWNVLSDEPCGAWAERAEIAGSIAYLHTLQGNRPGAREWHEIQQRFEGLAA